MLRPPRLLLPQTSGQTHDPTRPPAIPGHCPHPSTCLPRLVPDQLTCAHDASSHPPPLRTTDADLSQKLPAGESSKYLYRRCLALAQASIKKGSLVFEIPSPLPSSLPCLEHRHILSMQQLVVGVKDAPPQNHNPA